VDKKKIIYRSIAAIVAVVVLAGSLVIMNDIGTIGSHTRAANAVNEYATTDDDRKMAEDISDITGISVYRLLEMRENAMSWNDVMDTIQREGVADIDITDSELEALISAFPQEDIDYASAMVSRVIFNLREINAKEDNAAAEVPAANILNPAAEDDEYDFKSLEGGFHRNYAIYLVLALKGDFGSMELALDEYLYCLQIDVDLALYISDKDKYDRQLAEKSGHLLRNKAITAAIIEEKMLGMLSGNTTDAAGADTTNSVLSAEADSAAGVAPPIPDMPSVPTAETMIPAIENPMPKAPTVGIYDEINAINENARPY